MPRFVPTNAQGTAPYTGGSNWGYAYVPTQQEAVFGQQAVGYQNQADAAIAASLRAAQDAASTQNQYQLDYKSMGEKIAGLDQYPDELMGLAGSLAPYATTLSGHGRDLWDQGLSVYGHGDNLMGIGSGILNMNADPNSLAGRYIQNVGAIDPNRYVSFAAADVQQSYANAQGQMMRDMARQGVDASSGRAMSMQQKLADAMAAAQAGAKTRARQQGLAEQNAALAQALGIGGGMVQQGAGVAHTGAEIQMMGGNLQQAAAGVIRDQAGIVGQAGQLAQGNAGLAMQNALNLSHTQQNNAALLVNAQQNAANYYAQIAGGYGALAGSYGLANALNPQMYGNFM